MNPDPVVTPHRPGLIGFSELNASNEVLHHLWPLVIKEEADQEEESRAGNADLERGRSLEKDQEQEETQGQQSRLGQAHED